jgi:NADPH:quinone reductase-like Zn-dependent oxidoreductase
VVLEVAQGGQRRLSRLAAWAADGVVRVEVTSRRPFTDAVAAFESLEGGGRGGTVLLP